MHEAQPQITESELAMVRHSLIDRRRRLAALPTEAVGARAAGLLAELDATLDRLEGGGFGACIRCDGHVEPDRLTADPFVTVCLECLTPAERSALERDLELASQVQATLLPPRDLQGAGWLGHYLYRPHGTVSGDYVDVLAPATRPDDILVLVGDVAGKGVAAALLMSHLHAVLRATVASHTSLEETVERANRMLYAATTVNSYATLLAARLAADGRVDLCTAGHPAPLLLSGARATTIEATGLPLGLFRDARYAVQTVTLSPGDGLLLYTDGLTECGDSAGAELGVEGLVRALQGTTDTRPRSLVQAAVDAADRHRLGQPPHDDLTVMALQRSP